MSQTAIQKTDRYGKMFARLSELNQGAFVPFVTIGDPNKELSVEIIKSLIDGGADGLELGIPFSDPIADGPVIQAANIRALKVNINTQDCFDIIKQVRQYNADIPIGLLLYSNLVFKRGLEAFYQDAKAVGVDSILVADVPLHESKMFRKAAMSNGIDPIFIATPNAPDDTLRECASYGRGYTYLLSRAGVTGTETKAQMPATSIVTKLKEYHSAPALLGFGISTPDDVKAALNAGAAGAISGSAVVKIIEANLDTPQAMLSGLQEFVASMKAATAL
ncbi:MULTISPECIES: tryptophan synthase subunit alpha [Pseudoalteromonas]|jgi:tryptophan synthase alpha chain|uniref:Tryptophan synthase alpha chain n=1 Tax=Pseudoalteromonas rhizosphaerae TaxID=2518973 RepID=A0ABW8KZ00_9GAMM|nr:MULTISPECIES: tryptophan synthase subunit alpha [Pseudoalteromonas]MBB1301395.1 tryptophan synthase subunit alpha [Pseudoalteromonas sp. SR44-8]MBB1308247.1 tryptophan synthase subunit alpha [Pseudoalteromonas sp. SR41-8]MBB1397496.1 tryptophan synthase subunit alpha [Pseudoalteromonas sp. SG44-8]MBB1411285.1 tryptophan synthase subunit alpha [Pseudoalteromonas sp. SG44-17]MBB1466859.1 tryptophan synthase subunit alpha [Pseudoalteromonas sp. SG41-5]|tara:strand:+ start:27408 stop:28238 length:831 start_codon:yes stop_codon:yes gene_type:complete